MTQISAPSNTSLLQGEVFLKQKSDNFAQTQQDDSAYYLDENNAWLLDAGLEKIVWKLEVQENNPNKLFFVVQVKIKEEMWNNTQGQKPWEAVKWKFSNLVFKPIDSGRPQDFSLNKLQNEKTYTGQQGVVTATTTAAGSVFACRLHLMELGKAQEEVLWHNEKGFGLLFYKDTPFKRAAINITALGLNEAINSFDPNKGTKAATSSSLNAAGLPDSPDLPDEEQEVDEQKPLGQDASKINEPALQEQALAGAALQQDIKKLENRLDDLNSDLAAFKTSSSKLFGQMADLGKVNPTQLLSEVEEIKKAFEQIKQKQAAEKEKAPASPPPYDLPLQQALFPDEKKLENLVYQAVKNLLIKDEQLAGVLKNEITSALSDGRAQAFLPQGPELQDLLLRAMSSAAASKMESLTDSKPKEILEKAAAKLCESRLKAFLANGETFGNFLKQSLIEFLSPRIDTLLPQDKLGHTRVNGLVTSILEQKINSIYQDDSSLQEGIARIVQDSFQSKLTELFNKNIAEYIFDIKNANQKAIDACNESITQINFRVDELSSFAMPDWQGIEREIIRKCLDLGDEKAPDGLEEWLTHLINNLTAELLPLDYLDFDNIQADIDKLVAPLYARRNEYLGLFAKAASTIVADNKNRAGLNPLGRSFMAKARQAFKNEPDQNGQDPLDNLPNPFVDGWQAVVGHLKQARKYKNKEGLLSFDEIQQQFAAKEIFDLVHTNRARVMALHEKVPQEKRKSIEELEEAFKNIEEYAGLERIAPEPGRDYLDEAIHSISKQVSEKEFFPNQVTEVDRVGYRLKSTGEILAKARVVVNRRSS